MSSTRSIHRLTICAVLAAIGIGACGSQGSTSTTHVTAPPSSGGTAASSGGAGSSAATVKLATMPVAHGTRQAILADAHGNAVYLLTGDSMKHPECTSGACLSAWPAVIAKGKPTLASGVQGKLAVWHHGGLAQLTLDGHPLYTYAGDSGGSAANGNDLNSFGGVWKVLNAHGVAAHTSTAASGSASTSSGPVGY
jgi:predicted lipoprotein with Yx(FWY)xxD motif